ncbi:MAG TPA: HD domain-containing protein [Candidatus Paceibacterota bacterium]|nr:HD domain-containing protein [Candidatus Paceibacterota bacterium]
MLDRIRIIFTSNDNRESFFNIIGRHWPSSSAEFRLIKQAYDTAKSAFRGVYREGGERYFEHLRCVTLILTEHLRVSDVDLICAALLHDLVEDIPDWNQERVALEFNPRIAQLVWWVSKPPDEVYESKEAGNRAYHENLRRAPREALIIKLCDRLHNLLTQWDTPKTKRQRKIKETQDFYLPLAVKEIVLIHEIEEALQALEE